MDLGNRKIEKKIWVVGEKNRTRRSLMPQIPRRTKKGIGRNHNGKLAPRKENKTKNPSSKGNEHSYGSNVLGDGRPVRPRYKASTARRRWARNKQGRGKIQGRGEGGNITSTEEQKPRERRMTEKKIGRGEQFSFPEKRGLDIVGRGETTRD